MTRFMILFLATMLMIPGRTNSQDFWQPTNGPDGGSVALQSINPVGHIFGTCAYGVYRSTDAGDHWAQVRVGFPGISVVSALTVTRSGTIFIGGSYQIGRAHV